MKTQTGQKQRGELPHGELRTPAIRIEMNCENAANPQLKSGTV